MLPNARTRSAYLLFDNIVQNSSLYGHSIIFYDSTIPIVKTTILFWCLSSITFLKWKCFTLEYFDVLQNSSPSETVVRNSNCNFSLLTSHPLDFIIPFSISFELCYLLPHPLHLFPSLSFLCPSHSLFIFLLFIHLLKRSQVGIDFREFRLNNCTESSELSALIFNIFIYVCKLCYVVKTLIRTIVKLFVNCLSSTYRI